MKLDFSSLKKQLKSYWLEYVEQREVIESIIDNLSYLDLNANYEYRDAVAAINTASTSYITQIPWVPMLLKRSVNLLTSYLLYDDQERPAFYDGVYTYGQQFNIVKWEIPERIIDFKLVQSSPNVPVDTLIKGSGFEIRQEGTKRYALLPATVFDGFNVLEIEDDAYLVLWIKFATVTNDFYFTFNQLANGFSVSKDARGAELVKAVYTSNGIGANKTSLISAISSLAGIPVAKDSETIMAISDKYIVTDKNSYRYTGVPLYSVGARLNPLTPLTSGLEVYFGAGISNSTSMPISKVPGSSKTIEITINDTPGLPEVYGSINNISKIKLPSSGSSDDLAFFWDYVNTKSISSGVSLCKTLYGVDTVSQDFINKRVNTLDIFAKSVFASDYYIVIDSSLVDTVYFMDNFDILKRLLSPGSEIHLKVV